MTAEAKPRCSFAIMLIIAVELAGLKMPFVRAEDNQQSREKPVGIYPQKPADAEGQNHERRPGSPEYAGRAGPTWHRSPASATENRRRHEKQANVGRRQTKNVLEIKGKKPMRCSTKT